jgi:hypothetical protein
MVSVDQGRTWRVAFTLGHSSAQCDEPPAVGHCQVCMATEPRDCAVCAPGYARTPWPRMMAEKSGTPPAARRCCDARTGQCDAV